MAEGREFGCLMGSPSAPSLVEPLSPASTAACWRCCRVSLLLPGSGPANILGDFHLGKPLHAMNRVWASRGPGHALSLCCYITGKSGEGWPRFFLELGGRAELEYWKSSPLLVDALDPGLLSVGTPTVCSSSVGGEFSLFWRSFFFLNAEYLRELEMNFL